MENPNELPALPEPEENEGVKARQAKQKAEVLEELKKVPIVEFVCKKIGIGRTTFYRWKKEDAEFSKSADKALNEGIEMMGDLSESQLFSAIRDRELGAITFFLKHRHPKYSPKLEVTGTLKAETVLTPEQEQLIQKALRLAGVAAPESDKEKITDDRP